MSTVHFIVPKGIDDRARPSGGNVYDRRVGRGLTALGWSVTERMVPGCWPTPEPAGLADLAEAIAAVPDGGLAMVDGLIASAAGRILLPEASRVRLVVLVHMPLFDRSEVDVLTAATAVITTSSWTRRRLLERYPLRSRTIHVAAPGVDPADLAPGTPTGGELLCVAAVQPAKGHDAMVAALATVAELPWRCVCVGSVDRDPDFVELIRRRLLADGLADRVQLAGPRVGSALDAAYAAADALVLASRAETYGMVVTEALARGLPVIATAVGGLPEAMGHGVDGIRPGLLIPSDDPVALAAALRSWLVDAGLRQHLRSAARERRGTLTDWSATAARIGTVLAGVAA